MGLHSARASGINVFCVSQFLALSLDQVKVPRTWGLRDLTWGRDPTRVTNSAGAPAQPPPNSTQLIQAVSSPCPFIPFSGWNKPISPLQPHRRFPASLCLSFSGLNQGEQPVPSTHSLEVEPSCPQHIPVPLPLSQGGQPGWMLQFLWAQLGICTSTLQQSLQSPKRDGDTENGKCGSLYSPHLDLASPRITIKRK